MQESKRVKKLESKNTKAKEPVKITKFFLQGDKPAIIFNKKGTKILAQADKKMFVADTQKIISLLKGKGYQEVI